MAKRPTLEERLAALDALREAEDVPAVVQALRKGLTSRESLVVARAARVAGERGLDELRPELRAALERFFDTPPERDRGCTAKQALAEALNALGEVDEQLFLQGARYRQFEPVWGGQEDSAGALRGVCALALARLSPLDVLTVLTDLLADPESSVRAAAARALTGVGRPGAAALLRLKLLTDSRHPVMPGRPVTEPEDPQVMLECFKSLLDIEGAAAVAFVAAHLRPELLALPAVQPGWAQPAAMALGESRLPEAIDPLSRWFERSRERGDRRDALLALALLRQEEAFGRLLVVIARRDQADALDAITALAIYRHDEGLRQRVFEAVERRRGDITREQARGIWEAGRGGV